MTTQVKRYWKTIRKDASYMGRQESSSKKLTTRRVVKKSNNNYVYLLLSIRISKAFYVNKTRGSHSSSNSLTIQYQYHVKCGSCIYVKCSYGQYLKPAQVNIEDDAAEKFLGQLLATTAMCRWYLANEIPMKCLTQEQWMEYNNATNCSIYANHSTQQKKRLQPWPSDGGI